MVAHFGVRSLRWQQYLHFARHFAAEAAGVTLGDSTLVPQSTRNKEM